MLNRWVSTYGGGGEIIYLYVYVYVYACIYQGGTAKDCDGRRKVESLGQHLWKGGGILYICMRMPISMYICVCVLYTIYYIYAAQPKIATGGCRLNRWVSTYAKGGQGGGYTIYLYTYVYVYIYICVCVCVCVCVCTYSYICICIYMHIYVSGQGLT